VHRVPLIKRDALWIGKTGREDVAGPIRFVSEDRTAREVGNVKIAGNGERRL